MSTIRCQCHSNLPIFQVFLLMLAASANAILVGFMISAQVDVVLATTSSATKHSQRGNDAASGNSALYGKGGNDKSMSFTASSTSTSSRGSRQLTQSRFIAGGRSWSSSTWAGTSGTTTGSHLASDLKHRIVLLHTPSFHDNLLASKSYYATTTSTRSGKLYSKTGSKVRTHRKEFQVEAEKEHDAILRDLQTRISANVSGKVKTSYPSTASTSSSMRKVQDYSEVVNGFSAMLTEEEVRILKENPKVKLVSNDRLVRKHSTHAPTYLGLDNVQTGSWRNSTGAEVVIGILDSGIWPESLSFSDAGIGQKPKTFTGACDSGKDATFKCNRKLAGARFFGKGFAAAYSLGRANLETVAKECQDYYSPRDRDGHGTAMASIAASAGTPTQFRGKSAGRIRGVAYKASIAAYKVFWCDEGGYYSDIIAAIDASVEDGVDVLSLSLGGASASYGEYTSAFSYALYKAAIIGVPPVLSAGNDGPEGYSLTNGAPWMMTVGAGTQDRRYRGQLVLANKIAYKGSSFFSPGTPQASFKRLFPIIPGFNASKTDDYSIDNSTFCAPGTLDPLLAKGKIIVCYLAQFSATAMANEVLRVGGVAMVYGHSQASDNAVAARDEDPNTYDVEVPAVGLGLSGFLGVLKYWEKSSNPKAFLTPSIELLGRSQVKAPKLAWFSSTGPNVGGLSILKPDIIAPGYNIITAYSQSTEADGGPSKWTLLSGTSPACPFVAGTIALLKAKYPKWTTSMFFSAITTTASTVTNQKSPITANGIAATPFQIGSGELNPNSAINPGLVYALPQSNPYEPYLCSVESGIESNSSSFDDRLCDTYTAARDLNLPSVVFHDIFQHIPVKTKRILTNVGPSETYTVKVKTPPGTRLRVSPKTLTFKEGASLLYNIVLNATSPSNLVSEAHLTSGSQFYSLWWTFGSITWTGNKGHKVRIIVAVNAV